MKHIAVLGSTGSIGTQTLDVVRKHPDMMDVVALACGSKIELIEKQAREFCPELVAVYDEKAASDQLAISSEVYEGLKEQDLELAKQFRLYEPGVYVTNQGFKAYTDQLKYAKQSRETKKHGYNGAWGIDIK